LEKQLTSLFLVLIFISASQHPWKTDQGHIEDLVQRTSGTLTNAFLEGLGPINNCHLEQLTSRSTAT